MVCTSLIVAANSAALAGTLALAPHPRSAYDAILPSTVNIASENGDFAGMAVDRNTDRSTSSPKIDKLEVVSKLKILSAQETAKLLDLPLETVEKIHVDAIKKKIIGTKTHKERKQLRKQVADTVRAAKASGKRESEAIELAIKEFGMSKTRVRDACKEFGMKLESGGWVGHSRTADKNQGQYLTYQILSRLIEFPDRREVEIAEEFGVTPQMVNVVSMRARKSGVFVALERRIERERVAAAGGADGKAGGKGGNSANSGGNGGNGVDKKRKAAAKRKS